MAIAAGLIWAGALSLSAAAQPEAAQLPLHSAWAGLPLCFEAGVAAADWNARFIARGRDYQFVIGPTEAALLLCKVEGEAPRIYHPSHESHPVAADPATRERRTPCSRRGNEADDISDQPIPPPHVGGYKARRTGTTRVIQLQFVGASAEAQIAGTDELPGKINYLIGNDPARWRVGVPTFARVKVQRLYPGVDLVYYGNQRQLEYDFAVAPGADPAVISIRFRGVDRLRADENGELVLLLGTDEVRQHKPVMYQVVRGERKTVSGGYRLDKADTVSFAVGDYDRKLPLVIDPVLSYATYLGGSGADTAWAVAVDTNGFVYVAGDTLSAQLPTTPGAFQTNFQGGYLTGDAFVAKFSNDGSNLVYLTYLGGGGEDSAWSLAADGDGNAYITGLTDSTNFPIVSGIRTKISGVPDPALGAYPVDGFVAKLNAAGSALVYSTYLGGNSVDLGVGIAVDPAGNAYVTGYTDSTNFPTTNALQNSLGGVWDAFVAKIASNGNSFVYSTYLGGTNTDEGLGIAADAAGNAFVTGFTGSTNFYTTNALSTLLNNDTNLNSSLDAFVAEINPNGTAFVYSTFLGGGANDVGYRIKVDAARAAYVTGYSQSTNFPSTATNVLNLHSGISPSNSLADAFLTKLAPGGTGIVYSVVFGGTNPDRGWDLAVDPLGNATVVGITGSSDFPTAHVPGGLSATNSGATNVFVTAFNHDASALLYSAYLGGSANDQGYGIATDPAGNAYIVGMTASTNFPVVNAFQTTNQGFNGGFLAKIIVEPTLTAGMSGADVAVAWRAFAPEFVLESTASLSSPTNWVSVSAAPVLANGWHTVTLPATNAASFFRLRKP